MPDTTSSHRPRASRPRGLRLLAPVAVVVAATALAACGGGTETVVQTVPVPVGGSTGAGSSTQPVPPPTATTTSPTDAAGAARPALPDGRPAIDGVYRMELADYDPAQVVVGGDQAFADDLPWTARTTCDATGACRLELRRGLDGGGSKNLVLEPDGDDDRTWSVRTSGTSRCGARDLPPAPYRVSVRGTNVEQVDGRPTATRLLAYFRSIGEIDCILERRARASYRGRREG